MFKSISLASISLGRLYSFILYISYAIMRDEMLTLFLVVSAGM